MPDAGNGWLRPPSPQAGSTARSADCAGDSCVEWAGTRLVPSASGQGLSGPRQKRVSRNPFGKQRSAPVPCPPTDRAGRADKPPRRLTSVRVAQHACRDKSRVCRVRMSKQHSCPLNATSPTRLWRSSCRTPATPAVRLRFVQARAKRDVLDGSDADVGPLRDARARLRGEAHFDPLHDPRNGRTLTITCVRPRDGAHRAPQIVERAHE